ncbi:MAG: T9SS C-terminal target domain-containing protein, partial [Ignavibacteriae bacterium]|nr:T9SS C-terminal target domain-containing protein [Ignavibacteriota bacterium]
RFQIKDIKLVTLKVCDILGKEVAVLVNEKLSPGEYETQFPNYSITINQLPSGVYFYSLYIDGVRMDTKKMLLIK